MGFFDFFTKSATKTVDTASTAKTTTILAPVSGTIVELANVPDPVFAGKAVGDGVAILPEDNKIVAPFAGVITKFFHTHHAFVIQSDDGIEIMIHIGLDTVQLNGEGFTPKVKQGDRVSAGQIILELDLAFLTEKTKSVVTPVILLNEEDAGKVSNIATGSIKAGEPLYNVG